MSADTDALLEENARAVAQGSTHVSYRANGVQWELPVAPYRVHCLNELRRKFAALPADAQATMIGLLSESAIETLRGELLEERKAQGWVGRLGLPL